MLVDSDVLIDYLRRHDATRPRLGRVFMTETPQTTVVSQFELLAAARRSADERAVEDLLETLDILSLDPKAAALGARVRRDLLASGFDIGMGDSLIAGIALSNNLPLLSRNRKHFERVPDFEAGRNRGRGHARLNPGMRTREILVAALCCVLSVAARQADQPTPQPRQQVQAKEDAAAVGRGRAEFKSSCGFCHGNDATGSRAPDLIRSAFLSHDDHGNLLGPVIRNGRPDKGMPSFSTLRDDQVSDIVAFLHNQAKTALHSAEVPGDYPLAKLLTGDPNAGKAFFDGGGGCSKCHSVTGDLKGVARRYSPIDLQQEMIYPSDRKNSARETALVTLRDGTQYEGAVAHRDEFLIALTCSDGWYRSWQEEDVKVETRDPLEAHRELTKKYTDADIHNLFAYLETLK